MSRPEVTPTVEQLCTEWEGFLKGLIIKIGGHAAKERMDDYLQEVYWRIIEQKYLEGYNKDKSHFEDYLYQVVRTVVLNGIRYDSTKVQGNLHEFKDDEVADFFWGSLVSETSFENEVEFSIMLDKIERELDCLPGWGFSTKVVGNKVRRFEKSYRTVFQLLMQGFKKKDIAELLGVSQGSVSQYCTRLRGILLPMLEDWEVECIKG